MNLKAVAMNSKKHIPKPMPPTIKDKAAEDEAGRFGRGNYEDAAKHSEHQRSENIKRHMGRAAIFLFWLAVVALVFLVFSWLWSILAPASWQYLSNTQLSEVHTFLTSTLLVKAVSEFTKRVF